MPNWTFLLIGTFVALGLRTRRTWNVNAVAISVTIVVIVGVALREHLVG